MGTAVNPGFVYLRAGAKVLTQPPTQTLTLTLTLTLILTPALKPALTPTPTPTPTLPYPYPQPLPLPLLKGEAVVRLLTDSVVRGLIEFYLRWNNIVDQYGFSFVIESSGVRPHTTEFTNQVSPNTNLN